MDNIKTDITQRMMGKLTGEQLKDLELVLDLVFYDYDVIKKTREVSVVSNTNETILKNFLGSKTIEGCSKETIKQYQYMLTCMLDNINKDIPNITTNDIRYHLAQWQVNRGVSSSTINNMRYAYCSFFVWLLNEHYISENPMFRIPTIKVPKKQVKPFTESEIQKLYNACTSVRDRAIVEFLYSTGCRVSECSALNVNDIDFKRGTAIIRHGKGDKERTVYISEKSMYWLEKYLNERKKNDVALWTGKQGRLTKAGIEALIKRLGNKSGVYAHPHKFRHTLASDLAKRNAPVQVIQQMLGHEYINTTMVYVTIDENDIENAHRKYVA